MAERPLWRGVVARRENALMGSESQLSIILILKIATHAGEAVASVNPLQVPG